MLEYLSILKGIVDMLTIVDKGKGLIGSIKTSNKEDNIIEELQRLNHMIEEIGEGVYYAPSARSWVPLKSNERVTTGGNWDVNSSLSEIRKLTPESDIIASALYPIPKSTSDQLKADPRQIFSRIDKLKALKSLQSTPAPGLLPVLFIHENEFCIGWIKEEQIRKHFNLRHGGNQAFTKIEEIKANKNAAASPGVNYILNERFADNKNNWQTGTDTFKKTYLRRGRFVLEGIYGTGYCKWSSVSISPEQDFFIQTRIKHMSGSEYGHFGLFWYHQQDVICNFGINNKGEYYIGKYDKTIAKSKKRKWQAFSEGSSLHIKRKLENTLTIKKDMGGLLFYINRSLVYEHAFVDMPMRRIGFFTSEGLQYCSTRAKVGLFD
jgi:hypothetical protein